MAQRQTGSPLDAQGYFFMTYAQKLKDPRWQKKRLEILERDRFTCIYCGDTKTTLHVHHTLYRKGADPWEYQHEFLMTLCEDCHNIEHMPLGVLERFLLSLLRDSYKYSPMESVKSINEIVKAYYNG